MRSPARSVLYAILLLLCGASTALASSDAPRGKLSLGAIVGEPTGVSLGIGAGSTPSFAGALAWSLDDDVKIHAHFDYLHWTRDAVNVDGTAVPTYFGIGGRLRAYEGDRDDGIGVRFPLGVAWFFSDGAMMGFLEVAPVLDLVPDTEFDVDVAIGLRFVFGSKRR